MAFEAQPSEALMFLPTLRVSQECFTLLIIIIIIIIIITIIIIIITII